MHTLESALASNHDATERLIKSRGVRIALGDATGTRQMVAQPDRLSGPDCGGRTPAARCGPGFVRCDVPSARCDERCDSHADVRYGGRGRLRPLHGPSHETPRETDRLRSG